MTTHDQPYASDALAGGEPAPRLSNWINVIGPRLMTWVASCTDHYAAAVMYDRLSGLSDAQLARRGLSRATLARDVRVCATAMRKTEPAEPSENVLLLQPKNTSPRSETLDANVGQRRKS